ncbi:MAG: hypothetical protein IPO87_10880 [Flavobacteriales bacterium]|nr:hypothetical protein [Flavobacteriales bacterium]
MRILWAIFFLSATLSSKAQVQLDHSLVITGSEEQRAVIGLGVPLIEAAAVNVEVLSTGIIHWATAVWNGDTLLLVMSPALETVRDGLLVRFLPPLVNSGTAWLQLPGSTPRILLRHDGLPLAIGDLLMDKVAEVLLANGNWFLLNASREFCPPGSLPLNNRSCMEVDATPGLKFYEAVEHCGKRGGKLCVWDEYAAACTVLGNQLNGMFDEWEWIDDASNHTHTTNQAGRFTCESERSINTLILFTGDTRCCYHPR